MPKRPRSPDNVFRQFKIRIGDKEVNNGVMKENNMKKIYEKTINHLYEGSNPKNDSKRGINTALANRTNECKICCKCKGDIDRWIENKCEYCEKDFCYPCLRRCKICSNSYCTSCSLEGFDNLDEECVAVCFNCM